MSDTHFSTNVPPACEPTTRAEPSEAKPDVTRGARSIADCVYPERRFGGFTRRDGTIAFMDRVRALLQPAETVVDAGCGRGAHAEDPCEFRRRLRDLRGEGRHVVGIDVDPDASVNPVIDEFRMIEPGARWPVESGSAGMVYSDYVLEHLETPEAFFREAWRVLRPGGYLCIRTPNKRSYISLAARLIPDRLHTRVLGAVQEGRESQDMFPVVYRCNTAGRLRRTMAEVGFDACVYALEAEPSYMSFSAWAYRLAAVLHGCLPPALRSTLLAFGQKPGSARSIATGREPRSGNANA